MTTILYTHDICEAHDPGPMHPESPARLKAVRRALAADAFAPLDRREAPEASLDQIARVHPIEYVEKVLAAIPAEGRAALDGDTHVSPASGEAARRAAGAVCAAIDAIMAGAAQNAFCAVRPPGHHAEPAVPMGFCLFNNVAIGAAHAQAVHGRARVAVVDFDVHHGNGTQAMFWDDATRFFASSHQMPLYPGTGGESETGAHGNIVNLPLPPHAGSDQFRAGMEEQVLPALQAFSPDFLFISAGFDAHAADPLAQLEFVEADYAWATASLLEIADAACEGRVVSTLEGGYDLDALAASAAAHVSVLMSTGRDGNA